MKTMYVLGYHLPLVHQSSSFDTYEYKSEDERTYMSVRILMDGDEVGKTHITYRHKIRGQRTGNLTDSTIIEVRITRELCSLACIALHKQVNDIGRTLCEAAP